MAQSGGFGGFGGFGGGTNFTGLGSFLGAQDPGGYDPNTTYGLQSTSEGLRHLTEPQGVPTTVELPFSDAGNLDGLATWVRGSLYVSEFLAGISAQSDATLKTVTLSFDGNEGLTVHRPCMDLLRSQCRFVGDYMALRAERTAEITSQLGFPTPYFSMILGLHSGQNGKTFELITATQVAAAHAAMIVKHHLAIRRPDQLDARLMPMIPTPGHGSFPSAHATEAYAVLTVLEALVESWGTLSDQDQRIAALRGLAERIAVNRTVAGVHYPIDSWAGAALGKLVGSVVLNRAGVGIDIQNCHYAPADVDFFDDDQRDPVTAAAHGLTVVGGTHTVASTTAFSWLWNGAVGEGQN
ncbi:phosphatase PAP2 family protein [Loktanella sp. S4079]|uniref:phosphatase PAP2 family protein n=1 Tax=Loktanella sp. S4079 TaxID=579483 RepID=UPI0005FA004B|nr:phosphatase PAP2 family protein [Loktanella sp. S4079]KJZ17921.1 hypothetical protein TW80_16425 [Loktanella sp. S4079]